MSHESPANFDVRGSLVKENDLAESSVVCYLCCDAMSVLGVVCVALWLVPACGHRVVNGQAAEVEIQHVIHQDGVEATTKTVVAAAATGMTLPKLKKSFTEEELKTSVLANVVEVFWNLDLDDYNMLHLSSALGELAAMQALVSAGADVNAKCTEKGPHPSRQGIWQRTKMLSCSSLATVAPGQATTNTKLWPMQLTSATLT